MKFAALLITVAFALAMCGCSSKTTNSSTISESMQTTEIIAETISEPVHELYGEKIADNLYNICTYESGNGVVVFDAFDDNVFLIENIPSENDLNLYSSKYYLLNLTSGEKRFFCELTVPSSIHMMYAGFPKITSDEKIYITDNYTKKIILFDKELHKEKEYNIPETFSSIYPIYLDPNNIDAILGINNSYDEEHDLYSSELVYAEEDGATDRYVLSDKLNCGIFNVSDTKIYINFEQTDSQTNYLTFDTETRTITKHSSLDNSFHLFEFADYAFYDSHFSLWLKQFQDGLFSDDILHINKFSPNEEMLTICGNYVYTEEAIESDMSKIIRIYDIGTCECYTAPFGNLKPTSSTLLSGGYFIFTVKDEETNAPRILAWDFKHSAEKKYFELNRMDYGQVYDLSAEYSNQISKKSNVNIFFGKNGSSFSADYYTEPLTDWIKTYDTLSCIDDILSIFPDNMLSSMYVDDITELNIYITKKLRTNDSSSISSAAGLAFIDRNSRNIAIDGTLDYLMLKTNLAHEFMHIIDDRIKKTENESGLPYLSFWEALNGELEENKYAYKYVDDNGYSPTNDMNTQFDSRSQDDPEIIWFVDAYSKTFPTEDRARIMELLFADKRSALLDSSHIMEKAQYLCAVIRKCFNIPESTVLYWERFVDKKDIASFSDRMERFVPSETTLS